MIRLSSLNLRLKIFDFWFLIHHNHVTLCRSTLIFSIFKGSLTCTFRWSPKKQFSEVLQNLGFISVQSQSSRNQVKRTGNRKKNYDVILQPKSFNLSQSMPKNTIFGLVLTYPFLKLGRLMKFTNSPLLSWPVAHDYWNTKRFLYLFEACDSSRFPKLISNSDI